MALGHSSRTQGTWELGHSQGTWTLRPQGTLCNRGFYLADSQNSNFSQAYTDIIIQDFIYNGFVIHVSSEMKST